MRIKTIKIQNFRSVKDISIDLRENLNLFVGVNGSGKTTILDAIATSLSWLVKRIERQNSSGNYISDSDIRNDSTVSTLEITVAQIKQIYRWKLLKVSAGASVFDKSELSSVSELALIFQDSLANSETLPVIAYYPVNRVVTNTSPKIKGKESLHILDVYDGALEAKRNYHSFFEWFRLQDDILNEEAISRTKWVQQNQRIIKQRVNHLLELIVDIATKEVAEFEQGELDSLVKRLRRDSVIYEEPRFLFHELSHLIELVGKDFKSDINFMSVYRDLEYMFYKMGTLNAESTDNLIEETSRYGDIINNILRSISNISDENKLNKNVTEFIVEAFSLANIISLWWMSDRGKHDLDLEIKYYLDLKKNKEINAWFESTSRLETLTVKLKEIIQTEITRKKKTFGSEGSELKTVIKAIEQFVPEYSRLRVSRVPRPRMLINKGDKTFNIDQLSDGEKSLITLIGDIARRLAIANPSSNNPLHGDGIILIDEIDLHLHPKWQRLIVTQLTKVFPNCQFIITTHSPQIISHVKAESLFLLNNEENILSVAQATESYGMNSDRILEDLLDVDARPQEEKKALDTLFELIQDGKFGKAEELMTKFEYKDDPELIKARVLIKRKQIIGK